MISADRTRILITDGCGCIGLQLARHLADEAKGTTPSLLTLFDHQLL